jgi:thiosulfate reductase cytochrome b subunit
MCVFICYPRITQLSPRENKLEKKLVWKYVDLGLLYFEYAFVNVFFAILHVALARRPGVPTETFRSLTHCQSPYANVG